MILDAYSRRFLGAVAASALLHLAVVLAPYLGMTAAVSRPDIRSGTPAGRTRTLTATLAPASEPAPAGIADPATGTSAAGAPAVATPDPEPPPAPSPTKGIDLLPIPAPAYYTSDQLTRRPQPVTPPKLDLSPQLAPSFASGKVILKLWINELGAVTSVDVEQSDVPEAVSAFAAAAWAKQRFVPGERDGRPVGAMIRIEVTYDDPKPPP